MFVDKRYLSAFVVEKSKLTRLLGVIKNAIHQEGLSYTESFEARLVGTKTITADSLQHILDLDNSERSRVERLIIHCAAGPTSSDDPTHFVEVDFDGHRRPVDVTIAVSSDDSRAASDAMSVAEEQVERMLERSLMHQLFGSSEFVRQLAVVITMLIAISTVVLVQLSKVDSQISNTMWLTPTDLSEIEPMLRSAKMLLPEQANDILSRQLRNVIAQQSRSPFSVLRDWRVIVVLLPVVIVIGAFIVLVSCYPSAVFLWGDAEEWYRRTLARRGWLWNVVIVTLILGVITNLAVFALGSLISGRSS